MQLRCRDTWGTIVDREFEPEHVQGMRDLSQEGSRAVCLLNEIRFAPARFCPDKYPSKTLAIQSWYRVHAAPRDLKSRIKQTCSSSGYESHRPYDGG